MFIAGCWFQVFWWNSHRDNRHSSGDWRCCGMYNDGPVWPTLDAGCCWFWHGFFLPCAWHLLQGYRRSSAARLRPRLAESHLSGCLHVRILPWLGPCSHAADVRDIPSTCAQCICCHRQHYKLGFRFCRHKKLHITAGNIGHVWHILAVWSMLPCQHRLCHTLCTRDQRQITRRH